MGFGGYSANGGHDIGTRLSEQWARNRRHSGDKKPRKTVFDTDMCVHVWAQRSQSYGRNSKGSVYFEGDVIYSYGSHFPMAMFGQDKRGAVVVFINSDKYSTSTSGHQSSVRGAVSQYPAYFVNTREIKNGIDVAAVYTRMVETFKSHIADARNTRRSGSNRGYSLSRADDALQACAAFRAAFLNGNKHRLPVWPKDIAAIRVQSEYDAARREFGRHFACASLVRGNRLETIAHHAKAAIKAYAVMREVHAKGATGKLPAFNAGQMLKIALVARMRAKRVGRVERGYYYDSGFSGHVRRERDAIKRINEAHEFPANTLRDADRLLEGAETSLNSEWWINEAREKLQKVPQHCADYRLELPDTLASILERIHKLGELAADLRRRAAASEADKRDMWRRHEAVRLDYNSPVMLRLSRDASEVQTSKGATFPRDHAARAWQVIKACRASGRDWVTNGKTVHLGHFKIDRVHANGDVKAGCHFVEYAECENMARLLDLEQ